MVIYEILTIKKSPLWRLRFNHSIDSTDWNIHDYPIWIIILYYWLILLKVTVNGKRINITLLKKMQNLASYGCLGQQVSSCGYVTVLILQYPPAATDIKKFLLSTDRKVLNHYRIIKKLALNFTIRVLLRYFIFLFQINYYFATASFTSDMLK